MNTLEETWLDRPTAKILVRRREAANGRWLVFLHGAGADGQMFDAQIPAMPRDYGLCVWDARGHGRSSLQGRFRYADLVDDLAALIESLGAKDLTLIGQSMGGNLAQTFVARYPHVAQRMILIDCANNHGRLTWLEKVGLASTKPLFAAYPWQAAVRQSAAACGLKPETIAYTERALTATGKKRFIEVMDDLRAALTPDPEYRLPLPTLLLLGERDRTGNISKAMRHLGANDPAARLAVLTGASHVSNMDQPEVTNRLINEFLSA